MLRKWYGGGNWRNELSSFGTEILMQILWKGLCWLLGFVGIFLHVWWGFLFYFVVVLLLLCIQKLHNSLLNYSYLGCLSEMLDLLCFLIAYFERRCSSPTTSVEVGQRVLLAAEDEGRRFIKVGSSNHSKACPTSRQLPPMCSKIRNSHKVASTSLLLERRISATTFLHVFHSISEVFLQKSHFYCRCVGRTSLWGFGDESWWVLCP